MKQSPDNHINASFIDISRIKWLVFLLLRLSFFHTTSTCTLSLQAPKKRPIIDPHPVEQTAYRRDIKDINPSLQICDWYVKGTGRGQRDYGKHPQKSELIHWRQGHLSGATEPCPLGLGETLACIHVIPHNVSTTCGVLTRPPAKLAKKGMRVKTSADRRLKNWCELVNGALYICVTSFIVPVHVLPALPRR